MKNLNIRSMQSAIILLSLALGCGLAMGAQDPALNAKIEEIQKLVGGMAQSHQVMIVHMNRSQNAVGIKNSREEGDKARQGGKAVVELGKDAMAILHEVIASPNASRKLRKLGEEAVCFIKSSIHNAHEGMIHTHHIHMVSGLRGGVAHVKDAVNHARVSARLRGDAEEFLDTMLAENGGPDPDPYKPLPTKYCGFGEHAHLDKVLLDTAEPDEFELEGGLRHGETHHSHGEPHSHE